MKDILKKYALKYGSRFRTRKSHIFCIGAAKTGTTSIAQCLSSDYRTAHEPETILTNKLIIDKLDGNILNTHLKQELIKRDNRLKLEVESSHPLSYLSQELIEVFPKAKFIVTIREPYAWLESRLNFHYKKKPPEWEEYRNYFWIKKNTKYKKEEEVLKEYNLCTLETYLKQYAEQYKIIFDHIPAEKMLLIKTDSLNSSIRNIENFVNVKNGSLKMPITNKEHNKISVLASIEDIFIREKIWTNCHEIIEQFFSETTNQYN
mgnify:CR=1 FL=1